MKKINFEDMKMLVDERLETTELVEGEIETALKIIDALNGHMLIRAISILNYCSKAITRTKVEFSINDKDD